MRSQSNLPKTQSPLADGAVQLASGSTKPALTYSIEEASKRGGWGRSMTYQLINEGRLKAKKLGRRTIITDGDLQECIDELPPYQPKGKRP